MLCTTHGRARAALFKALGERVGKSERRLVGAVVVSHNAGDIVLARDCAHDQFFDEQAKREPRRRHPPAAAECCRL